MQTIPNHLDIDIINNNLEQLRKIRIQKMREVCKQYKNRSYYLSSLLLPDEGGVYVFWWTGSKEDFHNKVNRELDLAGPDKRRVKVAITDDWLNSFNNNICLYVGKNHDSLKKRVSKHLRLATERDYSNSVNIFTEPLKSTTGQLKRGLEELFINEKDIRTQILDNVGVSFCKLSGDSNSVNRFYLEDKAIGEFYPLLNLDIER